MKTKILIFLLVMGFGLVNAQTGKIKGHVSDSETGKPIQSAHVILMKIGLQVLGVTTDGDGNFLMDNISCYTYDIKIKANGYAPLKKVVTVNEGKTSTVNFSMQRETIVMVDSTRQVFREPKEKTKNLKKVAIVENDVAYEVEDAVTYNFSSKATSAYYVGSAGNRGMVMDVPYVEHNTESYDVINENKFKDVVNEPLSTFSVDVDRASYSNVRRFINQNQLPQKDVVRIEELINYFDYDYKQPDNGHPFSANMELGDCPWNEKHKLLMIGLQGEKMETEEIPPSNLVFLIDVSGSMNSTNKLPLLKKSFKILVDNLRPKDRVAMVVYAGAAGLVLESTPGDNKIKILGALDNLNAGGSTAGGAGIKLAYKVAKENFIKDGNNRVILATDGDFNVGESSDASMVRLIEEKRDDGIFLSVLGFGMGNYKDSKMEKLSNAGNGNYAYIDNIREAKKIFSEELWGTLYTIAKDVKIQIEFNPAKVKGYRLIGYENRMLNKEDFNDDKKDAGEIGSGHRVTALYEIIPGDSEEKVNNVDPLEYQKQTVNKSNNLLTLKLRYKDPDGTTSKLILEKVKENDIYKKENSENFKFAASVAIYGMILRDSEFKGNSSYALALSLAKSGKGKDPYGYRGDFLKMVETTSLLAR